MLRWLVIVLVAANAIYYAGTQGHLVAFGWPAASEPREPQRLERQIDPERLRLLNGPRGAEPVRPPARPPVASPDPSPPASASATQAPSPPAVVAANPAPPPAPTAPAPADAPPGCWQAGGFTDEQAELLRAELRLLGLADSAWQLAEVRNPGRWIVYMGRYDSAEQAARKKAELRGMGIDFRDVNTPGLAPGIAVGTFSSEPAAREGLQTAERRGVRTARVVQERAESLTFNLRLPAITPAQRQRIDALGPAMGGRSLQRCA
ncbi:MAG: SPOR domain-containing protein [Hydrogenophaga sp.]|nr:SPOR domain-containing protein [Hydrogenophaga sp.]